MPFPSRKTAGQWAAVLLLAACFPPAHGAEVRLLVQRSVLAGYRYHHAQALSEQLLPGEPLSLVREADNPHDANAIRVEWQGYKLGYVPRAANSALAWAMDRGEPVSARIAADGARRRARGRIEFDIYLR